MKLKKIFYSEIGIRSGWILAIFLIVYFILTLLAQYTFNSFSALNQWASSLPQGTITPRGNIAFTGLEFFILMITYIIVKSIDKKTFPDYYISFNTSLWLKLLQGFLTGFVIVSIIIGIIACSGGYFIDGFSLNGFHLMKYLLIYLVGFFLIGIFEEFAFRGLVLAVLKRSIGFWPAALALSVLFGLIHLTNKEVSWVGIIVIIIFGLLMCFTILRTGNIWFAVGLHSAFDFFHGFVYGTTVAGQKVQFHILQAHMQGSSLITGGNTGITASLVTIAVLLASFLFFHYFFPLTKSTSVGDK